MFIDGSTANTWGLLAPFLLVLTRIVGILMFQEIYDAYVRVATRLQKYRSKLKENQLLYNDLNKESDKLKVALTQSQDTSLRRISELREAAELDREAKAFMEQSLRMELEEKEHRIAALQTKVNLLRSSQGLEEEGDEGSLQARLECAESRLAQTQDGLTEANSCIATLKAQLSQKETEIRTMEEERQQERNRLQSALQESTYKQTDLEEAQSALKSALESCEREKADCQGKVDGMQEELESYKEVADSMKTALDQAMQDIRAKSEQVKSLVLQQTQNSQCSDDQVAQLNSQLSSMKTEHCATSEELSLLQSQHQELQSEMERLKVQDQLTGEVEGLNIKNEELTCEIEQLKIRNEALDCEVAQLGLSLEALAEEKRGVENELAGKMTSLQIEVDRLLAEKKQDDEERSRLKADCTRLSGDNSKHVEDISRLSEDNLKLREDNIKVSEDNLRLREDNSKLLEDNFKLRENNSKFLEDNSKLLEESKRIHDDNTLEITKLKASFQDEIQRIVENKDAEISTLAGSHQASLEELRRECDDKAKTHRQCLVEHMEQIESLKEERNAYINEREKLSSLLGEESKLKAALETELVRVKEVLASTEAQVSDLQASWDANEVLCKEKELELTHEVSELKADRDCLRSHHSEELSRREEELESVRREFERSLVDLKESHSQEVSRMKREQADHLTAVLSSEDQELAEKKRLFDEQMGDVREQVKEKDDRLDVLQKDLRSREDELRESHIHLSTLKLQIDNLTESSSAEIMSLRNELQALRSQLDSTAELLTHSKSLSEDFSARLSLREGEVCSLQKALSSSEKVKADLDERLSELRKELDEAHRKTAEVEQLSNEQKDSDQSRIKQLLESLDESTALTGSLQHSISQLNNEMSTMTQELTDSHNETQTLRLAFEQREKEMTEIQSAGQSEVQLLKEEVTTLKCDLSEALDKCSSKDNELKSEKLHSEHLAGEISCISESSKADSKVKLAQAEEISLLKEKLQFTESSLLEARNLDKQHNSHLSQLDVCLREKEAELSSYRDQLQELQLKLTTAESSIATLTQDNNQRALDHASEVAIFRAEMEKLRQSLCKSLEEKTASKERHVLELQSLRLAHESELKASEENFHKEWEGKVEKLQREHRTAVESVEAQCQETSKKQLEEKQREIDGYLTAIDELKKLQDEIFSQSSSELDSLRLEKNRVDAKAEQLQQALSSAEQQLKEAEERCCSLRATAEADKFQLLSSCSALTTQLESLKSSFERETSNKDREIKRQSEEIYKLKDNIQKLKGKYSDEFASWKDKYSQLSAQHKLSVANKEEMLSQQLLAKDKECEKAIDELRLNHEEVLERIRSERDEALRDLETQLTGEVNRMRSELGASHNRRVSELEEKLEDRETQIESLRLEMETLRERLNSEPENEESASDIKRRYELQLERARLDYERLLRQNEKQIASLQSLHAEEIQRLQSNFHEQKLMMENLEYELQDMQGNEAQTNGHLDQDFGKESEKIIRELKAKLNDQEAKFAIERERLVGKLDRIDFLGHEEARYEASPFSLNESASSSTMFNVPLNNGTVPISPTYSHEYIFEDPTQMEYLRSILKAFLTGKEKTTMAKVLIALAKFPDEEARRIIAHMKEQEKRWI